MNTVRSFIRRSLPPAVAVALVVAACATPALSPGTTATPVPSLVATATPAATVRPSPTEVVGPATEECRPADLDMAHGRVEGAAGSRFATLIVGGGSQACTLPAGPTVDLVDATGTVILSAGPAGTAPIDLPPGVAVTSTIQLANWCDAIPEEPVMLALVLGSDFFVTGGGPFPEPGGFPPCNGAGGTLFTASPWTLP